MRPLQLPANWHHRHYATVSSTMLCCDPEAVEPGDFVLVTADEQTAGRGQRGTTWESDNGLNLTFNIGWKADQSQPWPAANEQFLISEITAIAVVRTLAQQGVRATIKWPNDIYIEGLKICGMLLEHQLSGKRITASIAGIGINVNQPAFHGDAPNPVSLRQLLGHDVEREAVLESFVRHFMDGILQLQEGRYDEVEHTFTTLLYRRTGWHRYRDAEGEFLGEFAGIARNGTLTLRKQDPATGSGQALHSYAFKEVTFVI